MSADNHPTVPARPWTLLLYLGAQDNEAGVDETLLSELRRIQDPLRNVECLYQIALPNQTVRGRVSGAGKLEVLARQPRIEITDPRYISEYVTWGQRYYPGRYTALVLKDHGTGLEVHPSPGERKQGIFDNGGTYMEPADLRAAIAHTTRKHVDIYGFDACSMASVELAYDLRHVSSFFVGTSSPTYTAGWPYSEIVKHVEALGDNIGPRGLTRYLTEHAQAGPESPPAIGLELEWAANLASTLDVLARELVQNLDSVVLWARTWASTQPYVPDTIDLITLVDALRDGPSLCAPTTLDAVQSALHEVCIAGKGLSLFFPSTAGSYAFGRYGAMSFAQTNYWSRFISRLNSELLAPITTAQSRS